MVAVVAACSPQELPRQAAILLAGLRVRPKMPNSVEALAVMLLAVMAENPFTEAAAVAQETAATHRPVVMAVPRFSAVAVVVAAFTMEHSRVALAGPHHLVETAAQEVTAA